MASHPRGIHDVGGEPAGTIERTEHQSDFWEQRVDALMRALGTLAPPLVRTDELRRAIEGIGAQAYDSMSYYERWIAAVTEVLLEKGVISVTELSAKISEIEQREHE
ncbi:MAG: hypothetical protein ACREML_10520 [Vulcanimicrobiaceae bacterium]